MLIEKKNSSLHDVYTALTVFWFKPTLKIGCNVQGKLGIDTAKNEVDKIYFTRKAVQHQPQ